MVNDCSGEVEMVLKSAAVFCRLQTVPTCDWRTSLLLGPFQGLSSSAASGALSPGVSRGFLGIEANFEVFQTCFLASGVWRGHQGEELAVALATGHWDGLNW